MKRNIALAFGAVVALLLAAAGASAHTGFNLAGIVGYNQAASGDQASGARTESPEPSESPETAPKVEPTEKPEPTPATKPEEKPEPTETSRTSSTGDEDGGGSGDRYASGGTSTHRD